MKQKNSGLKYEEKGMFKQIADKVELIARIIGVVGVGAGVIFIIIGFMNITLFVAGIILAISSLISSFCIFALSEILHTLEQHTLRLHAISERTNDIEQKLDKLSERE